MKQLIERIFGSQQSADQDGNPQENTNQVLSQAIDAIVTIDENNNVIFYNDAAETLWGHPRSQVIGQNVKMLVPSEIQPQHDQLVNANRNGGADKIVGTNREIEVERADGQRIWANLSLSKVRNGNKIHYTAFVRDITQQRENNEFINQTLEQSIDPVVTIDENNNVVIFNGAAEKLWGYNKQEVIGKNVKMLVPAAIQHMHDDYVNANRRTKQDKIVGKRREIEVPRKDGSIVWCSLSLSRVEVGNKISYAAFVRDITEEKEQREYIEQTLEQAIDAVVAIDPDNNVITFNKAAEALWGYQREEVLGKNVKMLVPVDIQASHDSLVNANRKTGVDKIVGSSREVPVFRRDGEQRWGNLALSKVALGNKIFYTAFVKDVTEEVRLREEFKTLSLVANETDNSVIITDAKGLIQYANPGFTKLTNYTLEQVKGKKPGSLLQGPDTDPDAIRRIREKLDAREAFYDEILNYDQDGNSYWISLAINPVFDEKGKISKFVSIQANITETKMRSLEFNYKLDAISRANAVAEFDTQGKVISCNKNYCDLFGASSDSQLINNKLNNLIENEYAPGKQFSELWQSLQSGDFVTGEFKHRRLNGEELWLNASFNPIFDTSGNISKLVMFGTDATAKKQGIQDISAALNSLAAGDLNTQVNGEYDAEFNILRDNLNKSTSKLKETISSILIIADKVASGSAEIANGNNDLQVRVESQAASLEQTSSTMEELTSSAEANANNAKSVNQQSDKAGVVAGEGKELVSKAVTAMSEISSASRKISEIISVIDEIAFQTNLLALNAAVEAARAGEQGRGFAVVAGEVRNLAQRSATAAKEIGALINDTVGKVQEGTELVNTSGQSLEKIAEMVIGVSNMVSGITEASVAQLEGIQQANTAVSSMDSITQQNAALVEQANAASSEMSSIARQMASDLSYFSIR